jgi:hypothetical protein
MTVSAPWRSGPIVNINEIKDFTRFMLAEKADYGPARK